MYVHVLQPLVAPHFAQQSAAEVALAPHGLPGPSCPLKSVFASGAVHEDAATRLAPVAASESDVLRNGPLKAISRLAMLARASEKVKSHQNPE